jgi:hypothetical protein
MREWLNTELGGFPSFSYIDKDKNIRYRYISGEKQMIVEDITEYPFDEWAFSHTEEVYLGVDQSGNSMYGKRDYYFYTRCRYIYRGSHSFNAICDLVKIVTESGVIGYRLMSHHVIVQDSVIINSSNSIYPIPISYYEIEDTIPLKRYKLSITETYSTQVREKVFLHNKKHEEATEESLYILPERTYHYTITPSAYLGRGGLYVHVENEYGGMSYEATIGSKIPLITLSPMMAVFDTTQEIVPDPESPYGYKSYYHYKTIDKNGEYTTETWNDRRCISTYNNLTVSQPYFNNWDDDYASPTILIANNKDHYLVTNNVNNSWILSSRGDAYYIETATYQINGQTFDVSDFVAYFTSESMLEYVQKKGDNWRYRLAIEMAGSHNRNKGYMIISWFDQFIYKIRIDEVIPEPDFTEAIFYRADDYDGLRQERDDAKKALEPFGFKGGCFLFDVLANIKDDTVLEEFCKQIQIATGTTSLLKIYDPKTTALWVEKYEIIFNEGDGTAKIEYKERFLNPITIPLKNRIGMYGDWRIDTVHDVFSRLKSICYVPYDYVPPVENDP